MQKTTVRVSPAGDNRIDGTAGPQHARLDYARIAPEAVRAQLGLQNYINGSSLEPSLIELVELRASMINGCAYCVDMHTKDVSDELYHEVRSHFSEREVVDLTMAVVTINGWNRLAVGFRTPVGHYVPGSRAKVAAAASGLQRASA